MIKLLSNIKYLLLCSCLVLSLSSCQKDDDKKIDPIVGTWSYDTMKFVVTIAALDQEIGIDDVILGLSAEDQAAMTEGFNNLTFIMNNDNTVLSGVYSGIWFVKDGLYTIQDSKDASNIIQGKIVDNQFVVTMLASDIQMPEPIKSVKIYFKKS